ncbi:MAG: hypothetical protein CL519_00920 [Actinobacteria bacterium]|jgi:hypothetical protein|nr:hypothetical protein [Actinomycetota bacterium]MCH2408731.1 virulence factor [Acidimicrobiales bacterium]|tara:strand:- start:579 stop:899 length:321 start_codon:yes stop_codon:yes gene_type:complete
MPPKLITIYWRDIPAQVTAQEGRVREKALLEARFQHAIDRAAAVAGLTDTDSYIAQWNRKTFACEGDMAEAVAKEATKIEENYPAERLEILVKQGGVEGDDEKTIT